MFNWTVDDVAELLLGAGKIALSHYEQPQRQLKDDHSIVTNADLEIDAYMRERIHHPKAGQFLLSEESTSQFDMTDPRAEEQTVWIVDPIDGTAPYANHIPIWGISIGRAVKGTLVDGAVYLPVSKELFMSCDGVVYYREADAPIRQLVPPQMPPSTTGVVAITQGIAKKGQIAVRCPVQALGCAVFPLVYMLLGRYSGYLGTLKIWDIAGCLPLVKAMGFATVFLDGKELTTAVNEANYVLAAGDTRQWALRQPCLIAPPERIRPLLDAVDWDWR